MQLGRILIFNFQEEKEGLRDRVLLPGRGHAAPSGCRQAEEVRAPLAPKDLLLRDAGKSLPNGMDISAQDGWTQVAAELKAAQAMPGQGQGWRGTAGSAGAMRWLGKGGSICCCSYSLGISTA